MGGEVVKTLNILCIASLSVIHVYNNAVGMVFLKSNKFLTQLMLEKIVLYLMACLSFVSCQLEALLVSIGDLFCGFITFMSAT